MKTNPEVKTETLSARIEKNLLTSLQDQACKLGVSASELLRNYISEGLSRA